MKPSDDDTPPQVSVAEAGALAAEFLPLFVQPRWFAGPETPARTGDDGTLTLGYRAPSETLLRFTRACFERRLCFPFDWPAWIEEAKRLVEQPGAIEAAPLLDLRRLLTTFIRQNRFSEGALLDLAERGILTRVLARFAVLAAAGSSGPT